MEEYPNYTKRNLIFGLISTLSLPLMLIFLFITRIYYLGGLFLIIGLITASIVAIAFGIISIKASINQFKTKITTHSVIVMILGIMGIVMVILFLLAVIYSYKYGEVYF